MFAGIDPQFHMIFSLVMTAVAIGLFINEKIKLEVSAIFVMVSLLLFGQFFPMAGDDGRNLLDPAALMAGFANPSLIAVMSLLVLGQGLIHTDALRFLTNLFVTKKKFLAWISVIAIILFVAGMSAFMNNTPLVIIAIPVLQVLAHNIGLAESRIMIPLSFAAILGGMTTLIGSSTNLLVDSAMQDLGYDPIQFFDITVPGMMLAGIGLIYVLLFLPFLLPVRKSMADQLQGGKKEFIAELDIVENSKLIGVECIEGQFKELPDINVRMIQRRGHIILPPFEGYTIEKGDILIVAATRGGLTSLLGKYPGFLLSHSALQEMEVSRKSKQDAIEARALMSEGSIDEDEAMEQVQSNVSDEEEEAMKTHILAEIMVNPNSRIIDMTLEQAHLERQNAITVLGVQRRARVIKRRLGRIRLESGDVLLVAGSQAALEDLRDNPDFVVMAGTIRDLPIRAKAPLALGIFTATIGAAAGGILPIPVAALTGATLMVATGALNMRQAMRALDRKIFLLVGSALALGKTLEVTKAAETVAESMLSLPFAQDPVITLSMLFLLVAICTNLLTNNACAILFTPIAMSIGVEMGIDPLVMAMTVIFGANCSFASPIGYQTNLLVMGPGHYRFRDFLRAGIPLVIILWIAYTAMLKFYFLV